MLERALQANIATSRAKASSHASNHSISTVNPSSFGSGIAFRAPKISQPSTAVELSVHGLQLVGLEVVGRWLHNDGIEALDLLRTWLGNPSDEDRVACVPAVQNLEWYVWLGALARKERGLACKGQGAEL